MHGNAEHPEIGADIQRGRRACSWHVKVDINVRAIEHICGDHHIDFRRPHHHAKADAKEVDEYVQLLEKDFAIAEERVQLMTSDTSDLGCFAEKERRAFKPSVQIKVGSGCSAQPDEQYARAFPRLVKFKTLDHS